MWVGDLYYEKWNSIRCHLFLKCRATRIDTGVSPKTMQNYSLLPGEIFLDYLFLLRISRSPAYIGLSHSSPHSFYQYCSFSGYPNRPIIKLETRV